MAKNTPLSTVEEFLRGVSASNDLKKLLADETFVNSIAASRGDLERFFNVVQRDFRSDSTDPHLAQAQEWAMIRAIGSLRDCLLLVDTLRKSTFVDFVPEDDDDDEI